MKEKVQSAPGAIVVDHQYMKFVTFADDSSQAETFSKLYQSVGFKTTVRQATGFGFAVYANWR